MNNNDFEPLLVDGNSYKIEHLKNLSLVLGVQFSNADTRPIKVNMRPTNHVFSRKVTDEDWVNKAEHLEKGAWLTSYQHHRGNYQQVRDDPPQVKEHRIFCGVKWNDSLLFPTFVEQLGASPAQITVLANTGDDGTCLSGLIEIDERPDEIYLVFFSLYKVNSKEANMLIESAYCVDKAAHEKAKRLLTYRGEEARPFIIVLRNVMEGRLPMEGMKKRNSSYKRKKKKKNEKGSE
ncbi:hypothetical protein [Shewanella sp.]|uniref:hypothetical protein n=1 Tax=Shewanella sp. TaxID=50422 RepID=UPI003A983E84